MNRCAVFLSVALAMLSLTTAAEPPDAIFGDGFETATGCRWTPLRVTQPVRGATLQGDPAATVTVSGSVGNSLCAVSDLTLNGLAVTVAGSGAFSTTVSPSFGVNTLEFAADAGAGGTLHRVQSFLFSSGYLLPDPATPTSAMVDPGTGVWLSQEVIDDGDHSLPADDLATVMELAMQGENLASGIDTESPITSSQGYDIYIRAATVGSVASSLACTDSGMHSTFTLSDILGELEFDCTCTGLGCPCWLTGGDSTGGFSMDSAVMQADLDFTVNPDHSLAVTAANLQSTISGLDMWSDDTWTNALLSIIEGLIVDLMEDELESAFNSGMEDIVAPMLQDAFTDMTAGSSFALDRLDESGGTVSVNRVADFSAVDFDANTGGLFLLRSSAVPPSAATTYDNLGVPSRAGCGSPPQTLVVAKLSPMELSTADDLVNHQLHASWRGGWLETDLPPTTVDLTGYSASDPQVSVSAMLAPTAGDCNALGEFQTGLGELQVYLSLDFEGEPVEAIAHGVLTVEMSEAAGSGELAWTFGDPVTVFFDLELPVEAAEQHRSDLRMILEDFFLDSLSEALSSQSVARVPLPAVDASEDLGLPPGSAVIELQPGSIQRLSGNTVVSGGP